MASSLSLFSSQLPPEEGELYTLYVLSASNGLRTQTLALYARDELHARIKAKTWIKEHMVRLPTLTVVAYPDGYVFDGTVQRPRSSILAYPGTLPASLAEELETE
jgi:hypothetical protein